MLMVKMTKHNLAQPMYGFKRRNEIKKTGKNLRHSEKREGRSFKRFVYDEGKQ
jgi:hypothetical protein